MAGTWDKRLMTVERAFELVGHWRLIAHGPRLYCGMPAHGRAARRCDQQLGVGWSPTVQDILEAVLRHAVAAHDLNVGSKHRRSAEDDRDRPDPHPADRGDDPRHRLSGGAVDRYRDQEPAPRGGAPFGDDYPGGDAA